MRRFKLFAVFDLFETSDAYVRVLVGAISRAGPNDGLAKFIWTALVLRDKSECSGWGILGGSTCYRLIADLIKHLGKAGSRS